MLKENTYKVKKPIGKLLVGDIGKVIPCDDLDFQGDEDLTSSLQWVLFNEEDIFRQVEYPIDFVKQSRDFFAAHITKSEDGVDLYEGDEAWELDLTSDNVLGPCLVSKDSRNKIYFASKQKATRYLESKNLWERLKKEGFENGVWIKHLPSSTPFVMEKFKTIDFDLYIITKYPKITNLKAKDCCLIEIDFPEQLSDVKRVDGFVLGRKGNIESLDSSDYIREYILDPDNVDVYPTKEKALSGAAFIQLSQLHQDVISKYNKQINYQYFNNPVKKHWTIIRVNDELTIDFNYSKFHHFGFPTKKLAEKALFHWRDLWLQYYNLVDVK